MFPEKVDPAKQNIEGFLIPQAWNNSKDEGSIITKISEEVLT